MSRRSDLLIFSALIALALSGCSAKLLHYENSDQVLKVDEFDQKVEIKEGPVEPPPEPEIKEVEGSAAKADKKQVPPPPKKSAKDKKKKGPEKKEAKAPKMEKRKPELEDSVGFEGRRPIKDPFRVGEKVEFDVSYFNIVAGSMGVEVKPFAEVNGQKAYHFEVTARTNSFFSRVYKVEDRAVTYLDYENLVPLNLQISIKESKQLAETRTFFDWEKMKGSYWQKRITEDKGEQNKKIEWDLLPYSQNVISAAYYMRVFQWEVGKKFAFRVADEGKNIIFKGEVLRREELDTPVGKIKTIVVKPVVTVDGAFKPVGDMLMWMTDDDRKILVRMEAKIKIGTIVAKLKSLEKGRD
ncbi:MAG: DUF3108 domain-containing protein [Bdellovibrionales bacterium]